MIKLFEIFKVFFIVGIQLIGGGYVILPLLKKYLVQDRNWLKEEELVDYLALSQCLPGIIALNISIFSGWRLRKLKGAICAISGLLLPSVTIILLVAKSISDFSENIYLKNAFEGVRISVIVLIFFMIYDIFKKSEKNKLFFILFFLLLALILYTKITPTLLVIGVILFAFIKGGIKND